MPKLSAEEEQVRSILSIMLTALKDVANTVPNPSADLKAFKDVLDVWIAKLKVGGGEKIC